MRRQRERPRDPAGEHVPLKIRAAPRTSSCFGACASRLTAVPPPRARRTHRAARPQPAATGERALHRDDRSVAVDQEHETGAVDLSAVDPLTDEDVSRSARSGRVRAHDLEVLQVRTGRARSGRDSRPRSRVRFAPVTQVDARVSVRHSADDRAWLMPRGVVPNAQRRTQSICVRSRLCAGCRGSASVTRWRPAPGPRLGAQETPRSSALIPLPLTFAAGR